MMRIENIRGYRDKETGEKQKKGAVREVSKERGREIIKAKFAVEVKPDTPVNREQPSAAVGKGVCEDDEETDADIPE